MIHHQTINKDCIFLSHNSSQCCDIRWQHHTIQGAEVLNFRFNFFNFSKLY